MKGCAVLSQAAALGWSCGGKVSCAMGPGEHSQGVTLAAGVRRDTPPQQPLVPLWHPLSLSPKLCLVGTPEWLGAAGGGLGSSSPSAKV